MFAIKNLMTSAVVGAVLALAPVSASAVAISGDHSGSSLTDLISIGDIFQIEIDGGAADTGGMASFGFEATVDLKAIETNSLNPITGFAGATVEWNSLADGTGTVYSSLTTAEAIAGDSLLTSFLSGQTKWLIARWTDVTQDKSNFDLRVEATAIPVPAGGLLLLTALGGLGLSRRRKS